MITNIIRRRRSYFCSELGEQSLLQVERAMPLASFANAFNSIPTSTLLLENLPPAAAFSATANPANFPSADLQQQLEY